MDEELFWDSSHQAAIEDLCDRVEMHVAVRLYCDRRKASIYASPHRYTVGVDLRNIPWPEGMELYEVKQWAEAQYALIKI